MKLKWIYWAIVLLAFGVFLSLTLGELPNYKNNDTLFSSTIEKEPKNREALSYLGYEAMSDIDGSKAVSLFIKALNGNPSMYSFVNRTGVKANLGTIKMRLGQYKEAARIFKNLSKEQGEPVELDYNLGICYKMMRQSKKAYNRLIRYQNKYPTDVDVMTKLAEVYVDLGQRQNAIDELNKVLSVSPNHPDKEYIKIAIQKLIEEDYNR